MGMLVEDLLLLARLDEERPLRSEPVDLVPIAADAIEGAAASRPGARLGDRRRPGRHRRRGPAAPGRHQPGHATPSRTPPAGTPVTVRVGVERARPLLEVVDRGPGIPPTHAERVFERFYRVDPARARDHERSPATGVWPGTVHCGRACRRTRRLCPRGPNHGRRGDFPRRVAIIWVVRGSQGSQQDGMLSSDRRG